MERGLEMKKRFVGIPVLAMIIIFVFSYGALADDVVSAKLWVQTQSTLQIKAEPYDENPMEALLQFSPGNSGRQLMIPLGENYHLLANPQGEDRWYRIVVSGAATVSIKLKGGDTVYRFLMANGQVKYLP